MKSPNARAALTLVAVLVVIVPVLAAVTHLLGGAS